LEGTRAVGTPSHALIKATRREHPGKRQRASRQCAIITDPSFVVVASLRI